MAEKRPLDDLELDGLFEAARETAPLPSGDLMTRIMADAQAQIAQVAPPVAVAAPAERPGLLAGLLGMIGGWPAAVGLATATVVGLSVGLSTPDTLDDLTGGYLASTMGYDLEDLMPSYGDILGEG